MLKIDELKFLHNILTRYVHIPADIVDSVCMMKGRLQMLIERLEAQAKAPVKENEPTQQ